MHERRSIKRHGAKNLPVIVINGDRYIPCNIVNISRNGIGVISPVPLYTNKNISILLRFKNMFGDSKNIRLSFCVRYCQKVDTEMFMIGAALNKDSDDEMIQLYTQLVALIIGEKYNR